MNKRKKQLDVTTFPLLFLLEPVEGLMMMMIRVRKRLEVGGEVRVLIKVGKRGGRTEGALGCSWNALAGPGVSSDTTSAGGGLRLLGFLARRGLLRRRMRVGRGGLLGHGFLPPRLLGGRPSGRPGRREAGSVAPLGARPSFLIALL